MIINQQPHSQPHSQPITSYINNNNNKKIQEQQTFIINWINKRNQPHTHRQDFIKSLDDLKDGIYIGEILSEELININDHENGIHQQSTSSSQLEQLIDKCLLDNMKVTNLKSEKVCCQNLQQVCKFLKMVLAQVQHYLDSKFSSSLQNVWISTINNMLDKLNSKKLQPIQLYKSKHSMVMFMIEIIIVLLQDLDLRKIVRNAFTNVQTKQQYRQNNYLLCSANNHQSGGSVERSNNRNSSNVKSAKSRNNGGTIDELSQICYDSSNNHMHQKQKGLLLSAAGKRQSFQSCESKSRKRGQQHNENKSIPNPNNNIIQPQSQLHIISQFHPPMNQPQPQTQNLLKLKLTQWAQNAYSLKQQPPSEEPQPYIFLGQLINCILASDKRLDSKDLPIKPIHYDIGSYCVYDKVIKILQDIPRMSKLNLIEMKRQIEYDGMVTEQTYWRVVQDLYNMVRNKVGVGERSVGKAGVRGNSKGKRLKSKISDSDIDDDDERFSQKNKENKLMHQNNDNIKNQSVAQILGDGKSQKNKKKHVALPFAPQYDKKLIEDTEIWLSDQMGMGHSLKKSQPSAKLSIFENPLLNGNIFAKLLMRLKIGAPKGIISSPTEKKHMVRNIQTIKVEFLKRGYQNLRKLDVYRASYEFYIGLISQIRATLREKQHSTQKQILRDKYKRSEQTQILTISEEQKQDLIKWLAQNKNLSWGASSIFNNSSKSNYHLPLDVLKQVMSSVFSKQQITFLRETTENIQLGNYSKLLQHLRSIGLSQYYEISAKDILNDDQQSQRLRWMILADLKLLKGNIEE